MTRFPETNGTQTFIASGEPVVLRWLDGRRCEGTVQETLEDHGVFWIEDHVDGIRRLVFATELASVTPA